jgi:hypothetical protein
MLLMIDSKHIFYCSFIHVNKWIDDMVHSVKMNKALSIVERMVNQNAEDEIFQDFKFWEDVSDQFRFSILCISYQACLVYD